MFKPGQVVRMAKAHPGGGDQWKIIRVGMDFRIKCLTCGRSLMIPRRKFERKVKEIVSDVEAEDN